MTLVPTIEMLWESTDPHAALDERFGFASAVDAARWIAATVDAHWGVEVLTNDRIVISDRNALAWLTTPDGPMIAKWSVVPERFDRLREVATLTRWLDARGLPVSAPIPTSDGRVQLEVDAVSLHLQRVVAAELLDVGSDDQVRATGAMVAALHLALAVYPERDRIAAFAPAPPPLAEHVTRWVDAAGDHVPQPVRERLRVEALAASSDPLPTQLVHGDIRSSNILCRGSQTVAVIDFEETRIDHCVVELARSAVMLGTRFRHWGPVSPTVRAAYLAGYQSVRPLSAAETSWYDVLVLWQSWAMVPRGDDPTGWGRAARQESESTSAR